MDTVENEEDYGISFKNTCRALENVAFLNRRTETSRGGKS